MISEQKQIRTLLEMRIQQFKEWADTNPEIEKGLTIRKFPCNAELIDFQIAESGQQPAAKAIIKISFSNQHQLWSAEMQLSIFTRTIRKPGYEDLKPGIYFHTLSAKGSRPELIKPYKVILDSKGAYQPADFHSWYRYWVQRILKEPTIKTLFAHKKLVLEYDDEEEIAHYFILPAQVHEAHYIA